MITLEKIPSKTSIEYLEEDEGVVLLVPRYPTLIGRMAGRLLKRSRQIRIKLDNLGSTAWKLIDGKRNINELGAELEKIFGKTAEPVYPRLIEFLVILQKNKFITLKDMHEVANVEQ